MEANNNNSKGAFVSLYPISKDYNQLWDLIHSGWRVPAWLEHDKHDNGEVIWDVAEVKYNEQHKMYIIGSRGIGYQGLEQTKQEFIRVCEVYNLHYVAPNKQTLIEVLENNSGGYGRREVIIPMENSDYRVVCRFGYNYLIKSNWFGHLQKKEYRKKYILFGDRIEKWFEVDYCWWVNEIDSLDKLRKAACKFYDSSVLSRRLNVAKAMNIK